MILPNEFKPTNVDRFEHYATLIKGTITEIYIEGRTEPIIVNSNTL